MRIKFKLLKISILVFVSAVFVNSNVFAMNGQVFESNGKAEESRTFEDPVWDELCASVVSSEEPMDFDLIIDMMLESVYNASQERANIDFFEELRKKLISFQEVVGSAAKGRDLLLQMHKHIFSKIAKGVDLVINKEPAQRLNLLTKYCRMEKLGLTIVQECLFCALRTLNSLLVEKKLSAITNPSLYLLASEDSLFPEDFIFCNDFIEPIHDMLAMRRSDVLMNITACLKKAKNWLEFKQAHAFIEIALNLLLAKYITKYKISPFSFSLSDRNNLKKEIKTFFQSVNDCNNQEDFWSFCQAYWLNFFWFKS